MYEYCEVFYGDRWVLDAQKTGLSPFSQILGTRCVGHYVSGCYMPSIVNWEAIVLCSHFKAYHRNIGDIEVWLYSFLTSALVDGVGGQRHALAALCQRESLGTIVEDTEWAPGSVWTGMEKRKVYCPQRCSNQGRHAHSDLLYRLS
jgi:hypothetical protein